MHKFSDAKGRSWILALTIGSAMQVKAALQIDLLQPELPPPGSKPDDPPLMSRLCTDEYLLADVLCELLRKQMEAASLTEEDVRESFDGTTMLAAAEAFWDELVDFFQSRGRTDRATAVRKQAAVLKAAIAAAEAKVESIPLTLPGDESGELPA